MSVPESSLQDPKRDEHTIHAKLNRMILIHLWEDRTRGELWVPSYDSSRIVLVGDDFLRTASGNAVDAGRRTFEFEPIAPGTHQVIFEKRMGWKFTAEDRRVYSIHVTCSDERIER